MQQEQIVGPAIRKQLLNLGLDNIGGFIPHHLHEKVPDLRVAEHLSERFGVRSRCQQVAQCRLLVFVVGDDQG
jgi:hypothetical protein